MGTSSDPEDNIFYSSCLRRSRKIDWLPLDQKPEDSKPRYIFNSKCVSCDSYDTNARTFNTTAMATPQWRVDNLCYDCAAADRQGFSWWDDDSSGESSDKSLPYGAKTGIVVGSLILAVGIAVAVVYVVQSCRNGRGGNAFARKSDTPRDLGQGTR